ncbi:MAG TPA: type II toxin-antitoxin system VapC family toxin [Solirubrobacteraceae bacterium]|nr:type II toxin-antitoxin system VapC family toxin [Solirubrobacteraceae bacterium]
MKLADVNVLVYAVDAGAVHHDAAREWLEAALSGAETVAFAWTAIMGFLRVATHPAASDDPFSVDEAIDLVEGWLGQPPAVVVNPTERHSAILRDLLGPLRVGGDLVPDAHLAALAIEHGAELVSFDNDFARFAGLRWVNPGGG